MSVNISGDTGVSAVQDNIVTADKIATGAITVADIPDGEITSAKLASGAVTSAKLASGLSLSGNVYTSDMPSFKAQNAGGQINTNAVDLVWSDVTNTGGHNIGGHYNTSNGRFTAPIAGIYQFSMAMLTNNSASGNTYMSAYWMINGGMAHYACHNHNGAWVMEGGTVNFKLSAGDYVYLHLALGSGHYGTYSHFSGRLLTGL